MAADHARAQRGETLLETLLAIAILGILSASLFAGYQLVIKQTAAQRSGGTAETLLRTFAERIQDPAQPYQDKAAPGCSGGPTYPIPAAPTGYTLSVSKVAFWNPPDIPFGVSMPNTPLATTWWTDGGGNPICPATDSGLQQLTLTVREPNGTTTSMDVLKRRP